MKIECLLPGIIVERARPTPWKEWVPGTVLFADVSGFTPLSERLASLGAEGAERLTDILNRYFADMIGQVHARGGQVMKFGGDAILCFFPEADPLGDERRETMGGRQDMEVERQGHIRNSKLEIRSFPPDSLSRALYAALEMQAGMARFRSLSVPGGRVALAMKVGMASGTVLLGGVGDPEVRCDYLFAGPPVDAATEAEHHAAAGDIILACNESQVPSSKFQVEKIEPAFWRVIGGPSSPATRLPSPDAQARSPHGDPRAAVAYLIPEVAERFAAEGAAGVGALRDLVPVFLQFTGFEYIPDRFDLDRFHAFFTAVLGLTHRYLGRLNRVAAGDKGSTFLILFGAPSPVEKAELLAAQWWTDLSALVRERFPGIGVRAGIHAGRAFTGVVGGAGRWDYTVMGDTVNTAARLMMEAPAGGAALGDAVRGKVEGSFRLADAGARTLKGKREAVRVWTLEGARPQEFGRATGGGLVGREAERSAAEALLEVAREGKPALLALEGESGLGASLLAGRIARDAGERGWLVVIGRAEITTRNHPYAPWRELLKALLFGCLEPTSGALDERLRAVGGVDAKDRTLLRAHFGIEGTHGPAGEPGRERRRLHRQLGRLILHRARRVPVLLWLDDLHWFDSLSLELLGEVLDRFAAERLLVLAASRPCEALESLGRRPSCRRLALRPFTSGEALALLEDRLGGPAKEELVAYAMEHSGGNPFYLDQLQAYLSTAGLVEWRADAWGLSRRVAEAPLGSGGAIVAAKAERLDPSARRHVQMAACMGPTLAGPVLRSALGPVYDPAAVESLIAGGFLLREARDTLRFGQTVLQEALYASLLARLRRRLHRRIGIAMENTLGKRTPAYGPNLANHFHLAGDRPRALRYSLDAAEALQSAGSFPEACRFLSRAYRLLKRTRDGRKWTVGLRLGAVSLPAGRLAEGLGHLKAYRRAALRAAKKSEAAQALLLQFHLMHRRGDQGYTARAARLLRAPGGRGGARTSELAYLVGAALFRQGRHEEAGRALRRAVRGSGNGPHVLSALQFLASISRHDRAFEEALAFLRHGVRIAGETGDGYALVKFEIEEASLVAERGEVEDSLRRYMGLLPRIEQTGDTYLLATALLNIGRLHTQRSDFASADRALAEASRLFENLGVPNGRAKAVMNRGISVFSQGRLEEALALYAEATRVYESLAEEVEMAYGYYNLAETCLALGRSGEAREWIGKGTALGRVRADATLRGLFDGLIPALKKN